MSKIFAVIPLALTMNLGPQIITGITLLTAEKPVKKSLAYLAAALTSATLITFIAFIVFSLIKTSTHTSGSSGASRIIDYVFAVLLAALAIRIFLKRKEQKKPRWLSETQDASTKKVFVLGLMLYSFMPTDIVSTLTVGQYLASHQMRYYAVLPFLFLTLLIAAIPVLSFLLFRKRAEAVMPRVRDWLDSHAWLVNEVVVIFFIFMILFT